MGLNRKGKAPLNSNYRIASCRQRRNQWEGRLFSLQRGVGTGETDRRVPRGAKNVEKARLQGGKPKICAHPGRNDQKGKVSSHGTRNCTGPWTGEERHQAKQGGVSVLKGLSGKKRWGEGILAKDGAKIYWRTKCGRQKKKGPRAQWDRKGKLKKEGKRINKCAVGQKNHE